MKRRFSDCKSTGYAIKISNKNLPNFFLFFFFLIRNLSKSDATNLPQPSKRQQYISNTKCASKYIVLKANLERWLPWRKKMWVVIKHRRKQAFINHFGKQENRSFRALSKTAWIGTKKDGDGWLSCVYSENQTIIFLKTIIWR